MFELDNGTVVDVHQPPVFCPGRYIVVECESGSYRIKAGKHRQRTIVTTSTANDTIQFASPLNLNTGDGPFRFGFNVMAVGKPAYTFQRNVGTNDKLIRSTGSWLTDGFSATAAITIARSPLNSGVFTPAVMSTTTNANDTLEFVGDVFQNESDAAGLVVVGRGILPPPVQLLTDYWLAMFAGSNLQARFFTSRADALAGVNFLDITATQTGACRMGGNLGPHVTPGWTSSLPAAPTESTTDGEGEKLLRVGEQVIVSSQYLSLRAQEASVLKWWVVG
jgi:hypothetical protein